MFFNKLIEKQLTMMVHERLPFYHGLKLIHHHLIIFYAIEAF